MNGHEDSVGLVVALSVNIVTYAMIGGDLWVLRVMRRTLHWDPVDLHSL